ncbi:(2Fe-2S)-binding protein [Parapusillimonas granuli]|uniref:(2Fe-2S)-binding protein n=1 Tax=Parapusillimonas granuli TaxID=380911 RepID=A0A853FYJ4_9BURK|nr:(2Fe-2S)-binding protein [Parapusillimonas granuli]MBB5214442.1 aerobic-type carbon monoxide dehydrogenase small subunit (CoxS/CutS family) [Parapusillimonas granuli]MEB2398306.1 (2Fe-2S)-binding protein [Alcaligenaceae bacterium]NYT49149.1 (2Fe-2S)-binding protein [Parapusillimonas granuli]
MRITKGVARGEPVSFTFNGVSYTGYAGESVACALFASGMAHLRDSPRSHQPRGMFCLMGSCQECLVWVNGRKVPACQQPLVASLQVSSISNEAP